MDQSHRVGLATGRQRRGLCKQKSQFPSGMSAIMIVIVMSISISYSKEYLCVQRELAQVHRAGCPDGIDLIKTYHLSDFLADVSTVRFPNHNL